MFRSALFLLIMLMCLPVNGELLGVTTATSDGDLGGIAGAYSMCQTQFGSGSKICTTQEMIDDPNGLVDIINNGWALTKSDEPYFWTPHNPGYGSTTCGWYTSAAAKWDGVHDTNGALFDATKGSFVNGVCASSYGVACCK